MTGILDPRENRFDFRILPAKGTPQREQHRTGTQGLTWIKSVLPEGATLGTFRPAGKNMTKSYTEITANINRGIAKIREGAPDAMAGFGALAKGAMKAGALPAEQKELIALAIGVAGHCDGCIGFHAKALARLGTPREHIIEALAVAVYMGGGPSLMYAAEAMHALDEFQIEATGHAATPTP
jgi:AhpD family alkylhydroperoxidase